MSYSERLSTILEAINLKDEHDAMSLVNSKSSSKQKEVNYHRLRVNGNKAYIIPLTDMHLGHKGCNTKKLRLFLDYIMMHEDTWTILLGDQMENATRSSIGLGMFDEDIHTQDQLNVLYEVLKPLADKGKILGIHSGNHEFRTASLVGISPMELLAQRLDVPYLGFQAFHIIEVEGNSGTQKYTMMSYHGAGSGSTMGALINNSEKGDKICANVDLYISGHSHIKGSHCKPVYVIDTENKEMKSINRYYAICGSFLEYWGSYAEMKLLPPVDTGALVITLNSKYKDIKITH